MKDFHYLLEHFFTHKDYLAPPEQLPGTLFTPLHFAFASVVLLIVVSSSLYVAKREKLIKPVFIGVTLTLMVLEVLIISWESLAGEVKALDLSAGLSLYPCSIFMFAMPFAIWGRGRVRQSACGYVCTLGLLGAAVNFFYPAIRLASYSCISFGGFHTFCYHGSMLFTSIVMLRSGYHRYTHVTKWQELFLPCVPSLIMSIPANLVNYSGINGDYMFFRGKFPVVAAILGGLPEQGITLVLYLLYIFVPAMFYLPSFLRHLVRSRRAAKVS